MPRQRREFKIYNENIDRTFTQHQTKIEQLDDSITLQATSITTVSGRVDTLDGNVSTLDGNVSTLSGNVSTLQGNYNTLSGDLSDLDTQVQTNEARMIIESNGILSTVSSAIGADTVISTVNQTAGQYIIDSNKIDLRGVVTFSDLSTNGNTTITGNNITTGVIKDTNSNTTFDLSTGALTIGSGSIDLGNNFSVTSSGVCTIKSGSISLGYNSTGNFYKFTVDNNGVLTTRYSDGDTAWKLDGSELQIYSDRTGSEVGAFTYSRWRPTNSSTYYECVDMRYMSGSAFVVNSLRSNGNYYPMLSIEDAKTVAWNDMECWGDFLVSSMIVNGDAVWQGAGSIGYEANGSSDIQMSIKEGLSNSKISITAKDGNVHVYASKNDSIVQLHAGGGRVLHLGANGLQYYNGSTWSTLKLSNGQDSN